MLPTGPRRPRISHVKRISSKEASALAVLAFEKTSAKAASPRVVVRSSTLGRSHAALKTKLESHDARAIGKAIQTGSSHDAAAKRGADVILKWSQKTK